MNPTEAKKAVKERDGWACVDCGMTNEEHLKYFLRGIHCHRENPRVGYKIENCQTVCTCCHFARHGAKQFSTRGPQTASLKRMKEHFRSCKSVLLSSRLIDEAKAIGSRLNALDFRDAIAYAVRMLADEMGIKPDRNKDAIAIVGEDQPKPARKAAAKAK